MTIRIAYVIHKPRIGGAELHLLEVLKCLDPQRFTPLLVFLGHGQREPLYEKYRETGVEIVNLGMPDGVFSLTNVTKLRLLVRLLKAKRIDIVHGYLMEGNLLSSLAGFIAGVRIRITSKRSLERYNRKQLVVVKLSNLLSHKVTVVSNAVSQFVQEFEACPATKIAVIPNGVHPNIDSADAWDHADFRQYLAIPKDAFVVGTVARFGWKKGYEYFVQAAAMVARELPSVRFVGLGDGPLKQEIEALADRLGVSDHVVFPGWERDVRQKVALFDVYLCTSIIEGMSNALLEAMAERRPVIATAVGGNRETVRDGVTGYLVPPADPAALARRILELAGDPQLAERMGRAGRASVLEDYSVDRMMARMEDLYSSLIERDTRLQTHEGMSP